MHVGVNNHGTLYLSRIICGFFLSGKHHKLKPVRNLDYASLNVKTSTVEFFPHSIEPVKLNRRKLLFHSDPSSNGYYHYSDWR